jgi:mannosyltransferase
MEAKRALAALTLIGGVLRFATLDLQSFWLDESVTVGLVRLDFGTMLHRIPDSESSPPLYYVLAWLWTQVFGSGEVGLRSLSALLGTLSIPVAYAAASELCSRRVGLAVAALASVSPVLVWYSQEGRAYALLVLLGGLSLWSFARLLRQPEPRIVVVWGLASALAMTSHYFAAFLVLPEAVWLAARPATRRQTLPALVAVAAIAAALLPLALHQRALDLASFITGESLALRLAKAGKSFLLGFESPVEIALTVAAGLIAAAGIAACLRRTELPERRGALVAGAVGAVAVAIPFVLALAGVDYLDARNLLACWLPLMVVVAAGLAATRVGWAGLAALCAMGIASVVGVALEPGWQRDDWRGMAEALGEANAPRALLVQPASGGRPLGIYLDNLSPFPETGTAAVTEVASMHPVRREDGGPHPDPPPRHEPPLRPNFERAGRKLESSYSLFLQRAATPQPTGVPDTLGLVLVPGEPAALLMQRP